MINNNDSKKPPDINDDDPPLYKSRQQPNTPEERLFFKLSHTMKLEEKLLGAEILQEVARRIEEEHDCNATSLMITAKKNLQKKLMGVSFVFVLIISGWIGFASYNSFMNQIAFAMTKAKTIQYHVATDDGDDDDKDKKQSSSGSSIRSKVIGDSTFPFKHKQFWKGKRIFNMKARLGITELTEYIYPRFLIKKFMPSYLYGNSFVQVAIMYK